MHASVCLQLFLPDLWVANGKIFFSMNEASLYWLLYRDVWQSSHQLTVGISCALVIYIMAGACENHELWFLVTRAPIGSFEVTFPLWLSVVSFALVEWLHVHFWMLWLLMRVETAQNSWSCDSCHSWGGEWMWCLFVLRYDANLGRQPFLWNGTRCLCLHVSDALLCWYLVCYIALQVFLVQLSGPPFSELLWRRILTQSLSEVFLWSWWLDLSRWALSTCLLLYVCASGIWLKALKYILMILLCLFARCVSLTTSLHWACCDQLQCTCRGNLSITLETIAYFSMGKEMSAWSASGVSHFSIVPSASKPILFHAWQFPQVLTNL